MDPEHDEPEQDQADPELHHIMEELYLEFFYVEYKIELLAFGTGVCRQPDPRDTSR